MHFGWKVLIPISIVWLLVLATYRAIENTGGINRSVIYVIMAVLVILIVGLLLLDSKAEPEKVGPIEDEGEFDAFAGGYPVPPMPTFSTTGKTGRETTAPMASSSQGGGSVEGEER